MAVGTGLALGLGSLVGGLAGGSDETQTRTVNIAPPSGMERDAQEKSWQSYLQQLNLAQQGEQGIQGGAGVQGAARQSLESILGGQAFNLTPEEQQRIQDIRSSMISQGSDEVQKMINENIQRANASAATRGVRGQALSELQGRGISAGAEQMGNLVQQANLVAAQQAQQAPLQRIGLQGGLANQNANFMEQLRQQAIANRQALQNPVLMNNLQQERMAAAGVTNTNPASFGDIAGGALAGAGAGIKALSLFDQQKKMAQGGRVDNDPYKRQEIRDFARGASQGGSWEEAFNNIRQAVTGQQKKPIKMAEGGFVPGQSAFAGDSMLNDTVDVSLSPGEIVVPKSFAKDPKLAKAFIDYQFRQEMLGGGNGTS